MVLKLTEKAKELIKNKDLKVMKKESLNYNVENKTNTDLDLFEKLRIVRKNIATEERVPPYVICSDKSLKDMCEKFPMTLANMLNVQGFGEVKAKKYGEKFITEIKDYVETNNIETKSQMKSSKSSKENTVKSYEISCQMYLEGKTIKEISTERNLAETTIESHIFEGYENGLKINLDIFISKGNEQIILDAIKSSSTGKLREIKDSVPENISYTEIKAVYAKHFWWNILYTCRKLGYNK